MEVAKSTCASRGRDKLSPMARRNILLSIYAFAPVRMLTHGGSVSRQRAKRQSVILASRLFSVGDCATRNGFTIRT
jgi:hypothetical protein